MKAKLILLNWVCSWIGIAISAPFWAVIVGAGWFMISTYLFTRAAKSGAYKAIEKRFKIDEL